ncbi:MAG TPA: hypothetical protein VKZ50_16235 [bacterium]|nr:hypothetical protein [bacterium]
MKRLWLLLLFLAALLVGSALPPSALYPKAARYYGPTWIENCRLWVTSANGLSRCLRSE